MLYDNYEKKIKKVAKVKNFIVKFRVLFISIFALIVAASSTFLAVKGNFKGEISLPDNITYGDEYEASAEALFSDITNFQYRLVGETEWKDGIPSLAGEYEVRAVTEKSFNRKGYSRSKRITIAKKGLTLSIGDEDITYGSLPEMVKTKGLSDDDKVILDSKEGAFKLKDPKLMTTTISIVKEHVKVVNKDGLDVTNCYDIKTEDKEISFNKLKISVAPKAVDKVYDGQPLAYNDEFVITSGNSFVIGDEFSINTIIKHNNKEVNEMINAGSYETTITDFTITSGDIDLKDNYNITTTKANHVINKRPISIKISDLKKTYDATPLSTDASVSTEAGSGLVEGHTLNLEKAALPYITNVSTRVISDLTNWVSITDSDGNDVTSNYEISFIAGTLEVEPIEITVITASSNKTYDGTPLTSDQYSCEGTLATGEELYIKEELPSITNYQEKGLTNNLNIGVKKSDDITDVTNNYKIKFEYGTLMIDKIKVTLTPRTIDSKIYDGKTFDYDEAITLKYGNAINYEANVDLALKETEELNLVVKIVDDLDNLALNALDNYQVIGYDYDIISNFGNNKDNYEVTYDNSNQVVNILKRDITIKAYDQERRTYNGEAYEYDLKADNANYEVVSDLGFVDNLVINPTIIYHDQVLNQDLESAVNARTYDLFIKDKSWSEEYNENYNITVSTEAAKLTIDPKDITLTPKSDEKIYDGKAFDTIDITNFNDLSMLCADDEIRISEYVLKDTNLVEYTKEEIINAKEYTLAVNQLEFVNETLESNYNITTSTATITIARRDVTIKAYEQVNMTYNGEAYEYQLKEDGANYEVVSELGFVDGLVIDPKINYFDQMTFDNLDSAVNARTYDLFIKDNSWSEEYNENYHITVSTEAAKLTIDPYDLTIKLTDQQENFYTGKLQNPDLTTFEWVGPNRPIGSDVLIVTDAKVNLGQETEVKHVNKYGLEIVAHNFTVGLKSNYNVKYNGAIYQIKPLKVTVSTADLTGLIYGNPYYYEKNAYKAKFVDNSELEVTAKFYDEDGNEIDKPVQAGRYQVKIDSYKFKYGRASDYEVVINEDKVPFEIARRKVTIKATNQADYIYNNQDVLYDGKFELDAYNSVDKNFVGNDIEKITITDSHFTFTYEGNTITVNPRYVGTHNLYVDDYDHTTDGGKFIDRNYEITFSKTGAKLEIKPAKITVKPNDKEKIFDKVAISYGNQDYLIVSKEGSLNEFYGEDYLTVTVKVTETNTAIINNITGIYAGKYSSVIDDYEIISGNPQTYENGVSNYDITFEKGNVKITKRTVSIEHTDMTDTIYNANEVSYDKNLFITSPDSELDFVSTDKNLLAVDVWFEKDGEKTETIKNAGIYQTFIHGTNNETNEYLKRNYLIVFDVQHKLDFEIKQLEITLKPQNGEVAYYGKFSVNRNPVVVGTNQFAYNEMIYIDEVSFYLDGVKQVNEHLDFGTYEIVIEKVTPKKGTLLENYDITYETGSLTVVKRKVTIEARTSEYTYNNQKYLHNGDFMVIADNGVALDTPVNNLIDNVDLKLTSQEFEYSIDSSIVDPINAGVYQMAFTEAAKNRLNKEFANYEFTYNNHNFEILKQKITVTPRLKEAQDFVYNGQILNPELTFTLNKGTIWEDLETVTMSYTINTVKNAGVYSYQAINLYVNGEQSHNYGITSNKFDLTVQKRKVVVEAIYDETIVYDGKYHKVDDTHGYVVVDNGKEVSPTQTLIDGTPVKLTVRFTDPNGVIKAGVYQIFGVEVFDYDKDNFDITIRENPEAKLTITRRKISIKPVDYMNILYTGKAFVYDAKSSEVTSTNYDPLADLIAGHSIIISVNYTQDKELRTPISVGSYVISIDEVVIYDSSFIDVTKNYEITKTETAKLVINQQEITLGINELKAVYYNGTAFELSDTMLKFVDGKLNNNDKIMPKVYYREVLDDGSLGEILVDKEGNYIAPKNAGTYKIYFVTLPDGTVDFEFTPGSSASSKLNYKVVCQEIDAAEAALNILALEIQLEVYITNKDELIYSGQELKPEYSYRKSVLSDHDFVEGEGLESFKIKHDKLVDRGSYVVNPIMESIVFKDNTLESNYRITFFKGTVVEVLPLEIVVEFKAKEFTYNNEYINLNSVKDLYSVYKKGDLNKVSLGDLLEFSIDKGYYKERFNLQDVSSYETIKEVGTYELWWADLVFTKNKGSNFKTSFAAANMTINPLDISLELTNQEFTYNGLAIDLTKNYGSLYKVTSDNKVFAYQELHLDLRFRRNGQDEFVKDLPVNADDYEVKVMGYKLYETNNKEYLRENYNITNIGSLTATYTINKLGVLVSTDCNDSVVFNNTPYQFAGHYDPNPTLIGNDELKFEVQYEKGTEVFDEAIYVGTYKIKIKEGTVKVYTNGVLSTENNYEFSYDYEHNGQVTITPRPINVTLGPVSHTYNGEDNYDINYSIPEGDLLENFNLGFKFGYTDKITGDKLVDKPINAGTYGVQITDYELTYNGVLHKELKENFILNHEELVYTIEKAKITIETSNKEDSFKNAVFENYYFNTVKLAGFTIKPEADQYKLYTTDTLSILTEIKGINKEVFNAGTYELETTYSFGEGVLVNNYEVTVKQGSFKVLPKKIWIESTLEFDKVYDGEAITITGNEWKYVTEKVPGADQDYYKAYPGHNLSVVFNLEGNRDWGNEQTRNKKFVSDSDSIYEAYTYNIWIKDFEISGEGKGALTSNYQLKPDTGNVLSIGYIRPRDITTVSGSYDEYYNGKDVMVVDDFAIQKESANQLVTNHILQWNQKEPTIVENWQVTYDDKGNLKPVENRVYASVFDTSNGELVEVTDNYRIKHEFGTITVRKVPVYIKTFGNEFIEERKYLEADNQTVYYVDQRMLTKGIYSKKFEVYLDNDSAVPELFAMDGITTSLDDSSIVRCKTVGVDVQNKLRVKFRGTKDVTDCFEFNEEKAIYGILHISPRPIDIHIVNTDRIFDACEFNINSLIHITLKDEPYGYHLPEFQIPYITDKVITKDGEAVDKILEVGEYLLTVNKIKIMYKTADISDYYDMTIKYETDSNSRIKINKFELSITTDSESRLWNGNDFSNHYFRSNGDAILEKAGHRIVASDFVTLKAFVDGKANSQGSILNTMTFRVLDNENNDVTANYFDFDKQEEIVSYGTLSFSNYIKFGIVNYKEYDGTNSYNPSFEMSLFDQVGHRYGGVMLHVTVNSIYTDSKLKTKFDGEILNVGTYYFGKDYLDFYLEFSDGTILEEGMEGFDGLEFHDIGSRLDVSARTIFIKAKDFEWTYDGKEHRLEDEFGIGEAYEFVGGFDNTVNGDRIEIETNAVSRDVNLIYTDILSFTITNKDGINVTDNYIVITNYREACKKFGEQAMKTQGIRSSNFRSIMQCHHRMIDIWTGSYEGYYDGLAHYNDEYELKNESNDLLDGHKFSIVSGGSERGLSIINATSRNGRANAIKFRVTAMENGREIDVTRNYKLSDEYLGRIIIHRRVIVVKSASFTKGYDGAPVILNEYESVNGVPGDPNSGLIEGDAITRIRCSGTDDEFYVGEYYNTFRSNNVQIKNSEGRSVSSCYQIICEFGKIIIEPSIMS